MAAISAFDIFKIGVGPSSSHTLGPWRAAQRAVERWRAQGAFDSIASVQVDLYGSLAKTGRGHMTDMAIMLGLSNDDPVTCDTAAIPLRIDAIRRSHTILLGGEHPVRFDPATDCRFNTSLSLPQHPNGLTYTAVLPDGSTLVETYFSVGGGFIVREGETEEQGLGATLPFPIESAGDLLDYCAAGGLTIPEVVWRNELVWRTPEEIEGAIAAIWGTMKESVYRGCRTTGVLPGGLGVVRRAAGLSSRLLDCATLPDADAWIAAIRECRPAFHDTLTWVSCFALAVNEENAGFGRVVTAPTNGAAGVVPAVLRYYLDHCVGAEPEKVSDFLLTAAAIGGLIKHNASISGAEAGCQGEVGSAAAMAAAGLCAVLGGSPAQIENAAEIALEHHLGMTCDPAAGLVQVPCIERNGIGAIKAVAAASLALRGDGSHFMPLDNCIEAMRQTGEAMNERFKETSLGGLAVNLPEC
jgi:L-serine dehydratase